jgi:uncharacterized protein YcbK (DUF882 family)
VRSVEGRRGFLRLLLAAAGAHACVARGGFAQAAAVPAAETAPPPERSLLLFNTHTRESLELVFRRGKEFVPETLKAFSNLLRDHRNGESHDMDPALFDQLADLAQAAGVAAHYEIISGYRSPGSNSKMAAREGSGVSKNSLHVQGRAIDVRLRGCSCARLRDLALAAKRGGVGYYERSDFVHIDTGRFRTWVG